MEEGFAIVRGVVTPEQTSALIDALAARAAPRRGGVRNILERIPAVRALAGSAALRALVQPVLGEGAIAVRGILFDKTPDANWKVPWHQDLTIAVERRIEIPGFGRWTVKDGVQHVQPPMEILENMLAVRIHLDDCDEDNGALRVIARSHTLGRLDAEQIRRLQEMPATACPVPRGGTLLMRPLLLHASSAASSPRHRRVIHMEYASCDLPGGLAWHAASDFGEQPGNRVL